MGKKKNKFKYISKAARTSLPESKNIDLRYAKELQVIFGFEHLNTKKNPFVCKRNHGERLLYVFSILNHFSKTSRNQLFSYKNCHRVTPDVIAKHNLNDALNRSKDNVLHQLGRNQTPERIIGYFDSPAINVFQVLYLDLNHMLYRE